MTTVTLSEVHARIYNIVSEFGPVCEDAIFRLLVCDGVPADVARAGINFMYDVARHGFNYENDDGFISIK